jgi:hypothetical protein
VAGVSRSSEWVSRHSWPLAVGAACAGDAPQDQAAARARREQVLQVAWKARQAVNTADFVACCADVGTLPPADQPGPWTALAGHLAVSHVVLPDDDALLIRAAILDGLEALPAGARSAEKLAAPVLAVFEATRSMHRRALQAAGGPWPATLAATSRDHLRLSQLIGKHCMQALPVPMALLMARSFDPAATAADARLALLMFPRRLAELPAAAGTRGHVRGTLLRLALHACSPSGIPSLGEEGWGSRVRADIETALGVHGIPVAADAALSDALDGLDGLDTLVHVPPLAAQAA